MIHLSLYVCSRYLVEIKYCSISYRLCFLPSRCSRIPVTGNLGTIACILFCRRSCMPFRKEKRAFGYR
jgi:hypothetical protein